MNIFLLRSFEITLQKSAERVALELCNFRGSNHSPISIKFFVSLSTSTSLHHEIINIKENLQHLLKRGKEIEKYWEKYYCLVSSGWLLYKTASQCQWKQIDNKVICVNMQLSPSVKIFYLFWEKHCELLNHSFRDKNKIKLYKKEVKLNLKYSIRDHKTATCK